MPIYEYRCRDCGQRFEKLIRPAQAKAFCPSCKGGNLEQQFSVFAVPSRSPTPSANPGPGPCGTCGDPRGPGSCSLD